MWSFLSSQFLQAPVLASLFSLAYFEIASSLWTFHSPLLRFSHYSSLDFEHFSLRFQCQSPCVPLFHQLIALGNGWTNKECTFGRWRQQVRTVSQFLGFCMRQLQFPLRSSISVLCDGFTNDSYKNSGNCSCIYWFHLEQTTRMIWKMASN